MSTDSLGYMTAPSDVSEQGGKLPQLALVELEVRGLNGELVRTKLPAVCTGKQVRKMVAEKLPSRPGAKFLLSHGTSQLLMLDRTLPEQGIVGQQVTLNYTMCPTDLCAAWSFVTGTIPSQEEALEGLTRIEGATTSDYLRHLPETLQTLTFGNTFNRKLQGMTFPSNLVSLTFGEHFNQNLVGVTFPNNLQSLTFGEQFNQNLEGVTFPNNLLRLTFGKKFNQNLEDVILPSNLQSLTFDLCFDQNLGGMTFPKNLQSLTSAHISTRTLWA
jgi:hypothetical protein